MSAGIGAAYALREANKCVSFVILEARDHIGGRAYTDNECIPGVPVDLGAEWFIQVNLIAGSCLTTDPLYDLTAPRAAELVCPIRMSQQNPIAVMIVGCIQSHCFLDLTRMENRNRENSNDGNRRSQNACAYPTDMEQFFSSR